MDLQPHPDVHHLACSGLMGAGKTTVGSQVAERLGWSFVDVDALLEARTACSVGELWPAGAADVSRPPERDLAAGALRTGGRPAVAAPCDIRPEEPRVGAPCVRTSPSPLPPHT